MSAHPLPPELDPRGPRRPAGSGTGAAGDVRRGAYLGLMIVLTMLSTAIVGYSGYQWWTTKTGLDKIQTLDAVPRANRPATDVDGKDQNILIAGNDDRDSASDAELRELGTTRDGGSLNTDTMMVLHVPANGAKATIISFPRDSYVAIPGHGSSKLNSAYPDGYRATAGALKDKRTGGARLLVQTIQNLTGLSIDHFVQVDLLGFYRISNAIGGVPVVLCAAQKESHAGIDLPAGRSLIKGTQALAFVRQRYGLPNSDLDRIKRQQYFLTQAFRQIASASTLTSPGKLQRLLTAVADSLQLDPTLKPLTLAKQMQGLTADNIVTKTIPVEGFGDNEAGSVIIVDPAKVKTFVRQLVGTPATSPGTTASPNAVTVDVLNAGAGNGAAGRSAAALKKFGFIISTIDDTDASDRTVIKYPPAKKAQAQAVLARVTGATLQADDTVQNVTLVLGGDGIAAESLTARPIGGRSVSVAAAAALAPAGCIN